MAPAKTNFTLWLIAKRHSSDERSAGGLSNVQPESAEVVHISSVRGVDMTHF